MQAEKVSQFALLKPWHCPQQYFRDFFAGFDSSVAALAVFEGQRFLFIASTSDGESLVDSPTY